MNRHRGFQDICHLRKVRQAGRDSLTRVYSFYNDLCILLHLSNLIRDRLSPWLYKQNFSFLDNNGLTRVMELPTPPPRGQGYSTLRIHLLDTRQERFPNTT